MSRITQGLLADEKELKMGKKSWEGSAADTAQDKKLAKKHGMSMTDWEKSSMDTKHDTQKSMKGLRGGGIAVKGKGIALKKGGSVKKYAMGGDVNLGSTQAMPGGPVGGPGGGPGMVGPGLPSGPITPGLPPGEFGLGLPSGSITPAPAAGMTVSTQPMPGRGMPPGLRRMPVDQLPPGMGRAGIGRPKLGGMGRPGFKKGGVVEKDSGEMYASKAAMKKHEAKESPAMEKAEHKRGGGIAVKGKGIALRGGGMATRGMGIALKGGGRAKGCM